MTQEVSRWIAILLVSWAVFGCVERQAGQTLDLASADLTGVWKVSVYNPLTGDDFVGALVISHGPGGAVEGKLAWMNNRTFARVEENLAGSVVDGALRLEGVELVRLNNFSTPPVLDRFLIRPAEGGGLTGEWANEHGHRGKAVFKRS